MRRRDRSQNQARENEPEERVKVEKRSVDLYTLKNENIHTAQKGTKKSSGSRSQDRREETPVRFRTLQQEYENEDEEDRVKVEKRSVDIYTLNNENSRNTQKGTKKSTGTCSRDRFEEVPVRFHDLSRRQACENEDESEERMMVDKRFVDLYTLKNDNIRNAQRLTRKWTNTRSRDCIDEALERFRDRALLQAYETEDEREERVKVDKRIVDLYKVTQKCPRTRARDSFYKAPVRFHDRAMQQAFEDENEENDDEDEDEDKLEKRVKVQKRTVDLYTVKNGKGTKKSSRSDDRSEETPLRFRDRALRQEYETEDDEDEPEDRVKVEKRSVDIYTLQKDNNPHKETRKSPETSSRDDFEDEETIVRFHDRALQQPHTKDEEPGKSVEVEKRTVDHYNLKNENIHNAFERLVNDGRIEL